MKVFISWSGELSKNVATILNNWIPRVLQSVKAFISSDIAKGNTWFQSISTELKNSDYGILCLTKDNIMSPWLNFEAGALYIKFESSRVSPFLYDLQPSDIDGPLKHLQATVYTKEDVFRLISDINDLTDNKLDPEILKDSFETRWPDLERSFDDIHLEETQPGSKKGLSESSTSNAVSNVISDSMWENETKVKTKSIAIGFYNEILKIKKIINPIAEYYENHYVTVGAPTLLESVIRNTKVNLNKHNSLYDENGLYFHFRKEIYMLDIDTVKSISMFYKNLLQADKEYKIYINCLYGINSTKGPDIDTAWNIQDDFVDHLMIAHKEASNSIDLLENYII